MKKTTPTKNNYAVRASGTDRNARQSKHALIPDGQHLLPVAQPGSYVFHAARVDCLVAMLQTALGRHAARTTGASEGQFWPMVGELRQVERTLINVLSGVSHVPTADIRTALDYLHQSQTQEVRHA